MIVGGGLALLMFYGAWAASFDMKKVGAMPERNTVFDVDGKIYSRLAGSNRLRVSLDEVSPLFIDALLAREDTRFYQHPGVDWHGILRASGPRYFERARPRKVRAALRNSSRATVFRSAAATSVASFSKRWSRFESSTSLPKKQILELYVNRIYFGAGCYGVETASQAYFGKNASKLEFA